MHKPLQDSAQALLSLSAEELRAVSVAITESCESGPADEAKFVEKYGVTREFMHTLSSALTSESIRGRQTSELLEAWEDSGVVFVRAMNTFGDPIELGEVAASEFAARLAKAIESAS